MVDSLCATTFSPEDPFDFYQGLAPDINSASLVVTPSDSTNAPSAPGSLELQTFDMNAPSAVLRHTDEGDSVLSPLLVPTKLLTSGLLLKISTANMSHPDASSFSCYGCATNAAPLTCRAIIASGSNRRTCLNKYIPSLKVVAIPASIGSASTSSSAIPSPAISAMRDLTPLPSPLFPSEYLGPWKDHGLEHRVISHDCLSNLGKNSAIVFTNRDTNSLAPSYAPRRTAYDLSAPQHQHDHSPESPEPQASAITIHQRNRSASDYRPDPLLLPRRNFTLPGRHTEKCDSSADEPHIRREPNKAESRGLIATVAEPPTPPPSECSPDSAEGTLSDAAPLALCVPEYFDAFDRKDGKRRRWRSIGFLGQGTFSRVLLATNQLRSRELLSAGAPLKPCAYRLPDRRTLVAVKVCEHGPRGGASEERIEISIKREIDIMRSVCHPSVVYLRAWNIEPSRALLVLSYCPGGDLFDVATKHRHVLVGPLLRRIFAELVGAVCYLHDLKIVHRDIKLENVLVNLTTSQLSDPLIDWTTYPYSVVTLTDLGLSRRINDDEKLETRCGSDDYAAPEVLMGQPYDGLMTDAWSLGVLLYALVESRLPFDAHPGMTDSHRMRSRTSHRIARVEWRWIEYAGDNGEHDGNVNLFARRGLLGAMEITEGLLRRARNRWSVAKVAATEWVRDAINTKGELLFRDEKEGHEL